MTAFAKPAASLSQFVAWLRRPESPPRFQARHALRQAASAAEADAIRLLSKNSTFVVEHPAGREIGCLKSTLWITHDCDPKDIFLEAGDRYIANRETRMLVHATADAVVRSA